MAVFLDSIWDIRVKYRPEFPERFGSIEDARSFCVDFFRWYNQDHHHSGIGLMTPLRPLWLGRAGHPES